MSLTGNQIIEDNTTHPKIYNEQKEHIKELIKEGLSVNTIVLVTGYPIEIVSKIDSLLINKPKPFSIRDNISICKQVNRLKDKGLTVEEICDATALGENIVELFMEKADVIIPKEVDVRELHNKIRKLVREGVPLNVIARRMKLSEYKVRQACKELGIRALTEGRIEKLKFYRLVYSLKMGGLSNKEISKIAFCSYHNIFKICDKFYRGEVTIKKNEMIEYRVIQMYLNYKNTLTVAEKLEIPEYVVKFFLDKEDNKYKVNRLLESRGNSVLN